MITPTMRRYAAEIYRMQEERPYVSLADLADEVGASSQAVSRLIARLRERGMVEHEPYRGVRLTRAGEQLALPAIRRHRITEVFLVRVLGFGWDEVHEFSDRFELGIDERIEERIFEAAGRPARCPHGEPIPGIDGQMPVLQDASLVEMKSGEDYCLSRVRIHEPEKLRYLGELGLYPGTCFRLVSQAPFNGPVRIRSGRQEIILGHDLAAGLFVEAVSGQSSATSHSRSEL
ncbi:MAG TPA: metal-dependent transcriptional regulator [Anaerolineales bacterium]|jgi:DtxR family Mn-dependent transcriptional regulator|nr:metal-dependent transcriptional regulator [Anaerolineales bacterium]